MDHSYSYALKTQVGALCIALTTAGAFVSIPIPVSPVPIVLQNMFVVFSGLVLPPVWAFSVILVYLLLGAAGLPVLAGGAGGLAHFAGPTGGFLLAYPFAAWFTSILIRFGRGPGATAHDASVPRQVAAIIPGFLLMYILGVPRLAVVASLPLSGALWVGMVPFLPGDIVKTIALVALLRTLPASLWRSWS